MHFPRALFRRARLSGPFRLGGNRGLGSGQQACQRPPDQGDRHEPARSQSSRARSGDRAPDLTPTIGAEVHLPFGGTKATGNGHREAGTAALEVFSEWKSVYVDFSGKLQRAQIDTAEL